MPWDGVKKTTLEDDVPSHWSFLFLEKFRRRGKGIASITDTLPPFWCQQKWAQAVTENIHLESTRETRVESTLATLFIFADYCTSRSSPMGCCASELSLSGHRRGGKWGYSGQQLITKQAKCTHFVSEQFRKCSPHPLTHKVSSPNCKRLWGMGMSLWIRADSIWAISLKKTRTLLQLISKCLAPAFGQRIDLHKATSQDEFASPSTPSACPLSSQH